MPYKKNVLLFLFLLFYFIMVYAGFLSFELWGQVLYFIEGDVSPFEVIYHPHGARYAVIYPSLYVAQLFSIDIELAFALYVTIFMVAAIYFTAKVVSTCGYNTIKSLLFVIILFFIISLPMNGRIMFAICSASIQLYLFVSWPNMGPAKKFLYMFISILLSAVSSGTFILTLALYLVFFLIKSPLFTPKFKLKDKFLLFAMIAFIFLIPALLYYIGKNLNYYGGGVEGIFYMLDHGFGRYFFFDISWVTIPVILSYFFLSFVSWIHARNNLSMRFSFWYVLICLLGGLYGLSTFMISVPIIVVFMVVSIGKIKYNNQNILKNLTKQNFETVN